MIRSFRLIVFFLLCTQVDAEEKPEYIVPESEGLKLGRLIWISNCATCHGYGIADAPIPMQTADWKNRVVKDRTILYQHAIDGFIGESYSEMPARGGNVQLSDAQVKAAVDYMLFLANFYINKEGEL